MADPFSVAGLAIASNRGTVRNYITANTAADNAIQVNGSIRDVDFKKFWRGLSRIEKRPSERDESIGDPRIFVYEGREPRTAKPAVEYEITIACYFALANIPEYRCSTWLWR